MQLLVVMKRKKDATFSQRSVLVTWCFFMKLVKVLALIMIDIVLFVLYPEFNIWHTNYLFLRSICNLQANYLFGITVSLLVIMILQKLC